MIPKVLLLILGLIFEALLAVAVIGTVIAALALAVRWVLRWLGVIS